MRRSTQNLGVHDVRWNGAKEVNAPTKAVTRARATRATPAITAQRVERIAEMMQRGEWERGKSAIPLAEEWGLAVATVEGLSAEASRVVARRLNDPGRLKTDVSLVLMNNLYRASAAGEFGDVAKLGDVVTKVVGARAPERHEHAHVVVTSYESMETAAKVQWLREKAAELIAEADRLEGVVHVEVDDEADD